IGVLVVALGAMIAGAYLLGKRAEPDVATNVSGATAATAASAEMMPPGAAPAEANVQAPAGHPPVAEGGAPPTQGKVQVDPKAKFVHFRVGNRNVKDILSEGDVVWVGTSGGVIRYNTRTDEYKLLDTRSGLLSNGVFHLSRLDGKLAVGTYGGGLSLLDEKTGSGKRSTSPTDWATPSSTTCSRPSRATSGSRPGRASTGCAA